MDSEGTALNGLATFSFDEKRHNGICSSLGTTEERRLYSIIFFAERKYPAL